MDTVPFHAWIAHLPVALSMVLPLLASGVLLAWRRAWLPRQTWVIVVAMQAVLFAGAMIAERSGHQDEKRIADVVSAEALEAHEESAETFAWVSGVAVLVSLTVLAMHNPAAAQTLAGVAIGVMTVVTMLGYRAGAAGLELVYRHGAAGAPAASRR